ncbi:MAG: hypothetical protein ACP5E5_03675 [Acidobacteriaceae bacterium]
MSENTHTHHDQGPHPKNDRPYWKRAHHDWRFWVAVFFIGTALVIYVTSVDLSLVPRRHPHSLHVGQ